MELEQDVQVEVGEDLVEVDWGLAHTPERRLRHRVVGTRPRPNGRVVGRRLLRLRPLIAQPPCLLADLGDEGLARIALD